ncbi:MAG: hypothetical protein HW416_2354 [Chloroflexi bacterium]|nr:hypothetical protein [Chloroflexota bacterium]
MALRIPARFKADDIWDTPEDGNRYEVIDGHYEVIDGQLYVSPPPLEPHQNCARNLFFSLESHVRAQKLGRVYFAPLAVTLDDENAVEPDLVYLSNDRFGIISERGIEGAPDLVVEILSRSTQSRDRGIKLRRYAGAGIRHYWIVDPRARAIEAYELLGDDYELVGTVASGQIFSPSLFPGLDIPVNDLWT